MMEHHVGIITIGNNAFFYKKDSCQDNCSKLSPQKKLDSIETMATKVYVDVRFFQFIFWLE
jgi:hypothetical protein